MADGHLGREGFVVADDGFRRFRPWWPDIVLTQRAAWRQKPVGMAAPHITEDRKWRDRQVKVKNNPPPTLETFPSDLDPPAQPTS